MKYLFRGPLNPQLILHFFLLSFSLSIFQKQPCGIWNGRVAPDQDWEDIFPPRPPPPSSSSSSPQSWISSQDRLPSPPPPLQLLQSAVQMSAGCGERKRRDNANTSISRWNFPTNILRRSFRASSKTFVKSKSSKKEWWSHIFRRDVFEEKKLRWKK